MKTKVASHSEAVRFVVSEAVLWGKPPPPYSSVYELR
jgi:hypothetical protein